MQLALNAVVLSVDAADLPQIARDTVDHARGRRV